MHFRIYSGFLQIIIQKDCVELERILSNAQRNFRICYFSNEILTLDSSKVLKKRYFLNWLFHLQEMPIDQAILSYAYLPIQIRITHPKPLSHRIDVQAKVINTRLIQLVSTQMDQKTKGWIQDLFNQYFFDSQRLLLDTSKEGFWEFFMKIVYTKMIGDVVLHIDFENQAHFDENARLRWAYRILDSHKGESFFQIRKKYIGLVKKYHPDNVFGADNEIIQNYQERFVEIQKAFDSICASLN